MPYNRTVSNTDNINSIVNYICKYWDYFRLKTDKGQTRPLVIEGAPKWQDSYLKKNLWSKVPDWARHQDILTDWLTDWLSVVM
jgi:hypothetical protein